MDKDTQIKELTEANELLRDELLNQMQFNSIFCTKLVDFIRLKREQVKDQTEEQKKVSLKFIEELVALLKEQDDSEDPVKAT